MAKDQPPPWWNDFIDRISFKDIEERMFKHMMQGDPDNPYPEEPVGFTSSVVPFPDAEVIDMIRRQDGTFIRQMEVKSANGVVSIDNESTYYIIDECADVDWVKIGEGVFQRRPGRKSAPTSRIIEDWKRSRDPVAALESVRAAARSIPYWNRMDLKYWTGTFESPKPVVGVDWASGSDQTVVSRSKKPDVL